MMPTFVYVRCYFPPDKHYAHLWLKIPSSVLDAADIMRLLCEGYYLGCGCRMIVEELTSSEPTPGDNRVYTIQAATNFLNKYRERKDRE